jgi:hypothetical protein
MSSCSYFNSKEDGKLIASVYDKYLYEKDITELFNAEMSAEDSANVANAYIDKWIKDNLLLKKAELNLTIEQKDFEKQLENYRNSLITFNYEKRLVEQNLDTLISDQEILDYYNQNSANFELKNNILKAVFVKVSNEAPKVEKLRKAVQLKNEKDWQELEEYCVQFAETYSIDTADWLLFSEFRKLTGYEVTDEEAFIRSNPTKEWSDSTGTYFLNVLTHKIKSRISPLEFSKDDIRSILLNQRKLKLIAKMKQSIYEEALRKKQFEIYED